MFLRSPQRISPQRRSLWQWSLVRHGDRSPMTGKYLTLGSTTEEAEALLWRRLLPAKSIGTEFCGVYESGFAWRRPKDAKDFPYGALTSRGADRAKVTARNFVTSEKVTLRSTNYGRTLATARAMGTQLEGVSPLIEVRCGGFNGFDMNPKETMSAIREVRRHKITDPADLKNALIEAVPGATPDNFGWLAIVDYSETRKRHGLPTYDDSLLRRAKKHLRTRYDLYFQHEAIYRLVSVPALQELRDALRNVKNESHHHVNVAHDITILSLLAGLDARMPPSFSLPGFCSRLSLTLDDSRSLATLTLDGAILSLGGAQERPAKDLPISDLLHHLHDRINFRPEEDNHFHQDDDDDAAAASL